MDKREAAQRGEVQEGGADVDLVARRLGRLAIGVSGVGLVVALAGNTLNFIRDCTNEMVFRSVMGFNTPTVAECAKEAFRWIPTALKNLW